MYKSYDMKRKLFCFLIAGMLVVGLTACSDKNTASDTDDGMKVEVFQPDDNEFPACKFPAVDKDELGENECGTPQGIIFSKVVRLNGYEFIMGCEFEEFLLGAGAQYVANDDFEFFKENRNTENCWVSCFVEKNGKQSKFDVLVAYGENDKLVINGLVFDSVHTAINEFGCEIEVLGIDLVEDDFSDLSEELQDASSYIEEKDGYNLKLTSIYDDYVIVADVEKDADGDYDFTKLSIDGK